MLSRLLPARFAPGLLLAALAAAQAAPGPEPLPLRVLPPDTNIVAFDSAAAAAIPEEERGDARAWIVRTFQPRFEAVVARAARGAKVTGDSAARLHLRLDSLAFSLRARMVARRSIPPSSPGFDPATGEATPGQRHGRVEGPGWVNELSAAARWTLWDREGDSALARGTASGSASFRGDARRGDWEEAARELAIEILRGTPFAPPR